MGIKSNNNTLYAILIYFQFGIGCSLPSSQIPPTPGSHAQQVRQEYQHLREAFEQLQSRSFELEAYMDTARQNIEDGKDWPEEHAEILKRFELLEIQLQNTEVQLEVLKQSLAIQDDQEELGLSEPEVDN